MYAQQSIGASVIDFSGINITPTPTKEDIESITTTTKDKESRATTTDKSTTTTTKDKELRATTTNESTTTTTTTDHVKYLHCCRK